MNNWYLYRHIRLDTRSIFYIGIGCNKYRAGSKKSRNPYWKNIVAKTGFEIEIVMEGLSKQAAIDKEREFISLYGRMDLNTGCLANMTSGGEGVAEASEETRRKISQANKGRRPSEETRIKASLALKGKPQSDDLINKRANANRGGKRSQATKEKMRIARLGKKTKGWSEACKQKIKGRVSNSKGVKWSEESRARFSAYKKGMPISDEVRAKIKASSANRRPISDETRLKMRLAATERERLKKLKRV